MLYSVRQLSTTTWASSREPNSSTLSNSSRTRPLRLSTKGFSYGEPSSMWVVTVPFIRHQSRRPQAMKLGTVVHAQKAGRSPGGDEGFEDRHQLVGVAGAADTHGQGLAGVLVDDVEQLQPAVVGGLVELEVEAQTWLGRSARRRVPPFSGRRRLRLRGTGRRRPSERHSRCVRLRLTVQLSRRRIECAVSESTRSPHNLAQQVSVVSSREYQRGLVTCGFLQSARSASGARNDYGSEGWGFESLPAQSTVQVRGDLSLRGTRRGRASPQKVHTSLEEAVEGVGNLDVPLREHVPIGVVGDRDR